MDFTWSQYEKITRCNCEDCKFEKQGTHFVSHCAACNCADAVTTQCIPGFFNIMDRPHLNTWQSAATFFEERTRSTCAGRRGARPSARARRTRATGRATAA